MAIFIFASAVFIYQLGDTREFFVEQSYAHEALSLQKQVDSLIKQKQKASLALAIALSKDRQLIEDLASNNITPEYYKDFIARVAQSTQYKNIWIAIFDRDLKPHYRSWTKCRDSKIPTNLELQLQKSLEGNKNLTSVGSNRYTFGVRATVPILRNGASIGVLELFTHFNSISLDLAKQEISSAVLLSRSQSEEIEEPFNDLYIDDRYVANFDAPVTLTELLRYEGVEHLLDTSYKIVRDNLITHEELRDIKGGVIGHFVMSKKLKNITTKSAQIELLKRSLIYLSVVLVLLVLFVFYYYNRKFESSSTYKKIVDLSPNLIIVASKDEILEVNSTFFNYFSDFGSLEEFKREHKTLSEFFTSEDGYVSKSSEHFCWIDYIYKNPTQNKVKMIYNESAFYFSVSVSLIDESKQIFSVIFRDITKEELYKKELETTNITDTLTKIKNRYFYNLQLKKEASKANRYFYPLSLVIFDIDHFKKINDVYGHDMGDRVLIEYSRLVGIHLRDSDIFCRIGGEEFALILPHTTKAGAYKLADKLRIIVGEHQNEITITMSFGVAEYKKGEDLELLFKRADEALYEAKNGGRNRVVVR